MNEAFKDEAFLKSVGDFIRENELIGQGDCVTAALSGGADSVCLLLCLNDLSARMGFTLEAAHVNHGLRGAESDGDEEFSRQLCARLGIPFMAYHIGEGELKKMRGLSLEEAARKCRYAFLLRSKGTIAVAHHMDDQAETVLLNLFRGSGIFGMAGMKAKKGRIIRPLLSQSREGIEDFLQRRGQDYRTDSTNLGDDAARNRLRNNVMPYIRENINTMAAQHLARAAGDAAALAGVAKKQARWVFEGARLDCGNEGCVRLDTRFVNETQPVVAKAALLEALESVCGSRRDIGRAHLDALYALMRNETGSAMDLPYGMRAVIEYDSVLIYKKDTAAIPAPGCAPGFEDGVPPFETRIKIFDAPPRALEKLPQKKYTKWFDYDKINGHVIVRKPKDGDSIYLNRVGHKSLKKWMSDNKISVTERRYLYVAADNDNVLWLIGRRMNDAYRVTAQTEHILQMEILNGDPKLSKKDK